MVVKGIHRPLFHHCSLGPEHRGYHGPYQRWIEVIVFVELIIKCMMMMMMMIVIIIIRSNGCSSSMGVMDLRT